MSSDEMGNAGTPEPTTDRDPPETDRRLKDAGARRRACRT